MIELRHIRICIFLSRIVPFVLVASTGHFTDFIQKLVTQLNITKASRKLNIFIIKRELTRRIRREINI